MSKHWIFWAFGLTMVFYIWRNMKTVFTAEHLSLHKVKYRSMRVSLHILAWPLRLMGASVAALAATLVWALLVWLGYFFYTNMPQ